MSSGQLSISDYGVSGRGGPNPPLTVDDAVELYRTHRGDDHALLCATLLRCAYLHGTAHADDLRRLEIANANNVGSAFRALQTKGLIRQVGRRRSVFPATHGRSSGVYALTEKGERQMGLQ